jgi:hypothetical protein
MADKLSRDEVLKRLGRRDPLPGGPAQLSPQMKAALAAEVASAPAREGVGALPANPVMNPRAIVEDRLRRAESGMKCGGKVKKKMATGGSVRGVGCAQKGHGKGKVC